jgi:hypothetical protein
VLEYISKRGGEGEGEGEGEGRRARRIVFGLDRYEKPVVNCWFRAAPRHLDIDAQMLPDCCVRQDKSPPVCLARTKSCCNIEVVCILPPWLCVYSMAATVFDDLVVVILSLF